MNVARELDIPCVELTDSVDLPVNPNAAFHKLRVNKNFIAVKY